MYLWHLKPKLGRTCTFFRDLNSVDTGKAVQKVSQQTEQFSLLEEILHQLIGRLSHYSQDFIHPRWLFGISSINRNPTFIK